MLAVSSDVDRQAGDARHHWKTETVPSWAVNALSLRRAGQGDPCNRPLGRVCGLATVFNAFSVFASGADACSHAPRAIETVPGMPPVTDPSYIATSAAPGMVSSLRSGLTALA